MKAIVLEQPNKTKSNVAIADIPEPVAENGMAVVSVAYAGFNFADTMMQKGIYPHPKGYPLVAGIEMSGTVTSIGPGVRGIKVGDRVAAFCEDAGAFAEKCLVPAERLVRIPDQMPFDVAAAFFVQGLTAWHLLHTVSKTVPGDTVLVHAIGGGVGLYLTQLAAIAGATVLGTVGTAGKEKRALELGARRVVNRNDEDFRQMVMNETAGEGVDKIVDSTGGSILDRSFEVIRTLGHVVSYGEAEAKPYENLWERLVRKSLTFTRLHIGHIDCRSDAWSQGAAEVISMIMDGRLNVPIEGVYEMNDAHAMYERLASRTVAGKLILKIA